MGIHFDVSPMSSTSLHSHTMADNSSFIQLSESIQHLSFLQELPDTPDDEKELLKQHLQDLASRQENKLDNIVMLLKRCDHYIDALKSEMDEIKENLNSWKKNKDKLINIIKFAYQQNLIDSKITGNKYQATIKSVKPRLQDNFDVWDEDQVAEYGLKKVTTIQRIKDGTIIDQKEETLPDKDRIRDDIKNNVDTVPAPAQLVPSFSFVYERRKRITS